MSDVKLPDPKYIYHDDGESDDLFEFATSGAVDERCAKCERLYTQEMMLAFRAEGVAQALESLKFHPSASQVHPDYRDWFNKTIDAAIQGGNHGA